MTTTSTAIAPQEQGGVNVFGSAGNRKLDALVEVEKARAIADVQAALFSAKQFPRDPVAAMDRVLNSFALPKLAESAAYQYQRGGSDIVGPSIRAAETLAQCWGNIRYSVEELERRATESTAIAYAWDIETNTRAEKKFVVPHFRDTRRGRQQLTDDRDIYEHIANMGARRLRACILQVVPIDVTEQAMKQAETTLRTKVQITDDLKQELVTAFNEYGVTKDALEAFIQRRIDAITPALVVRLRRIYASIKDGMSTAADWFEMPEETPETPEEQTSRADAIKSKLGVKTTTEPAPAPAPATAQEEAPAEPAPAAEEKPEAAEPEPKPEPAEEKPQPPVADEKEAARELRGSITNHATWKAWKPELRSQMLKQWYNKTTLLELSLGQLQDALARLKEAGK